MRAGTPSGRIEEPADRSVDRRGLLRLGGAAAAIGAAGVLLRPSPAGAATGAMQFGGQNDAGADATDLTSANDTGTLFVTNSANAAGLEVRSGGTAVVATGSAGGGVVGITRGTGPGLFGQADAGTGPAIKAQIETTAATAHTVEAAQSGNGHGVFSHVDNPSSNALPVFALTNGVGGAVLASITNTTSKAAAVRAQTSGAGMGVDAASALGIGGRFAGRIAQIQLVPSTASSHPAHGTAGELFVDHSSRLWFCKGGTTWRQLA